MENKDIKLYNKSVFWFVGLDKQIEELLSRQYVVVASSHYFEKAESLNLSAKAYKSCLKGEIVECETVYGIVVKLVFRVKHKYDNTKELCFPVVLNLANGIATVRTVWINHVDDNHATINKENYYKPF